MNSCVYQDNGHVSHSRHFQLAGVDYHLLAFDSSVGRAVDCSCSVSEIHRSLVQIRLEGVFVNIFVSNIVRLRQATWL